MRFPLLFPELAPISTRFLNISLFIPFILYIHVNSF